MQPRPSEPGSLWHAITERGGLPGRALWGANASVALADLAERSSLGAALESLRGRSVLLATVDQLTAALALIELDGVARRIVLCPPDLPPAHREAIAVTAETEAVVTDQATDRAVLCGAELQPSAFAAAPALATEWILLTSGTTGVPKLVRHSFASLTAPIKRSGPLAQAAVWATFYDIRRYGGLQILLRALIGGGSMVLSSRDEPTADFLHRAGERGVTNISGTPSHWRRALMSPAAGAMAPRYVRLSGEIADQSILDALRAFYRDAGVAHAFASTEAGVAFEVTDNREGFPATVIGQAGEVAMKLVDGSLRIRSARTASGYLGGGGLLDAEGFVDTGDMVERRGERCFFVGRKGGIINVGGQKVHPEEVEAAINAHPGVRMSLVRARKSPITGAIVVADVVARDVGDPEALKQGILECCRDGLPAHKVPAVIRFVPSLEVTGAGKLARRDA